MENLSRKFRGVIMGSVLEEHCSSARHGGLLLEAISNAINVFAGHLSKVLNEDSLSDDVKDQHYRGALFANVMINALSDMRRGDRLSDIVRRYFQGDEVDVTVQELDSLPHMTEGVSWIVRDDQKWKVVGFVQLDTARQVEAFYEIALDRFSNNALRSDDVVDYFCKATGALIDYDRAMNAENKMMCLMPVGDDFGIDELRRDTEEFIAEMDLQQCH
ncbi:MAG: hypothetical protein H6861_05635 [Rhodospirillales bacterium]|nr:hypothetical protein [Rhodospirillales bacterium]